MRRSRKEAAAYQLGYKHGLIDGRAEQRETQLVRELGARMKKATQETRAI